MVLSKEQNKIEEFLLSDDSSLIIQALAGSGKTTTLIKVVLPSLLKKGVFIEDILVLMFSKNVNVEFEKRLKEEGLPVRSATFHSAGLSLLKNSFGTQVDFKKCKRLSKELGIESDNVSKLSSFCKIYGLGAIAGLKINSSNISKVADRHLIEVDDAEIYQCEQLLFASLKDTKFCDFDDMIWLPVFHNLKCDYNYVVVDECQDNSDLRNEFIKKCCGDCKLIAVGDRHQSIFSFAGSNNDSMDELKSYFKAKELPLTTTYRCSKNVTNFAKKWAPKIQHRENAPDGMVQQLTFSEFYRKKISQESAILCRLNSPLIPLAFHLANSGQRCYIKGKAIGEELANLAQRWKWSTLDELESKLQRFLDREKRKLLPEKENTYRNIVDKVACLTSIIKHCKENRKNNREHFVQFVRNLFSDDGTGIVLSTVHGAKGLEWKDVYIWGWEKLMPAKWVKQDWEKESEKCIQFVAVTRAINNLYLVS